MEEKLNTIESINWVQEIADFMGDEDLSDALATIAKLIIKPDIPLHIATIEIVRLEAIAAKMKFKATWMANVEKGDRAKKNIYYTAADAIGSLVAALKYMIR